VSADTERTGHRRSIREDHRLLTKQRLQEAGLDVFRERGYNQSSVEDISARAGVVRATFYLHFKNKFELIASIAEAGTYEIAKRYSELDELLANAHGSVPLGGISTWLTHTWDSLDAHSSITILWEELVLSEQGSLYKVRPRRSQIPNYLASLPAGLRESAWLKIVLLMKLTANSFSLCRTSNSLGVTEDELKSSLCEIWAATINSIELVTDSV
jgi:AcrR family transcriptional regulator